MGTDSHTAEHVVKALRELADGYFYDATGERQHLTPLGRTQRESIVAGELARLASARSATEPPHELQNRCLEHAAMIAEDHPDIAQRIRALKISEPFNAATHWDGCWRKHHGCAVAKIERLSAVTEIAAPEAGSDARKILNYAFTLLETNKSAELMIEYLRDAFERLRAAKRGYERNG